jgi:hypothetical protein
MAMAEVLVETSTTNPKPNATSSEPQMLNSNPELILNDSATHDNHNGVAFQQHILAAERGPLQGRPQKAFIRLMHAEP